MKISILIDFSYIQHCVQALLYIHIILPPGQPVMYEPYHGEW